MRRSAILAIALCLGFGASAAKADSISTTFTGTFIDGTSTTNSLFNNFFGYVGSLSGTSFSETITYTMTNEVQAINTTGVNGQSYSVGSTVAEDVKITYNGVTVDYNLKNNQLSEVHYNWVANMGTALQIRATNNGYMETLYTNINSLTAYQYLGLSSQAGLDAYMAGATTSSLVFSDGWGNNSGNLDFTVTSVSSAAATVPEPSSFAILGAALVGLGVARRRKAASAI